MRHTIRKADLKIGLCGAYYVVTDKNDMFENISFLPELEKAIKDHPMYDRIHRSTWWFKNKESCNGNYIRIEVLEKAIKLCEK